MNSFVKNRKILIFVLLTIFMACAFFSVPKLVSAQEEPTLNGVNLEQNYAFGQKLTLPEATIKYNGSTKRAQASTTYPSGNVVEDSIIYLTEEGVYKVSFYATFNGETKSVEQKFSVQKKLFTVQKETSSVQYATYNAEEHNKNNLKMGGSVSGAYVHLSAGDKLTYNKVLNLNGKTSLDSIIRVVFTPSTIGVQDVGAINIILTDAYNPQNYVTINALSSEENAATYVKVAASNGQVLSGWDYAGNRILSGTNPFGYAMYCLFNGYAEKRTNIDTIDKNYLEFAMDYAEKTIHAVGNYNTKYPSMIGDLDNADDYGVVWTGFTTGECFLSISCNDYVGQTADFVVQSVMGEQIVSNNDFVRSNPTLAIDYLSYNKNNLPKAQVNKQYKLFDIDYKSPYFSNLKLEEKVYFDYNGAKTSVEVVNGYFTPTKKGEYTVEVSVTDALEQSTVETYVISAIDQEMPIYISVIGEQQTSGKAGEFISICDIETNGGSGKINVEYSVTLNGQNVQITSNEFFPTSAGDYKVKIYASDYIGNEKEYEYTVTIAAADKPVFTILPVMPKYLISGNENQLQEIFAKDYITSSNKDVKAEILYQDAYGLKRAVNGKISPVVKNNGDLTKVIYKAKIGDAEQVLEYQIPTVIVRENNSIKVERLFVANGANSVYSKENFVEFRFFNNASYDFINPLALNGIDVRFSVDSLGANYQKVIVTLTDIYNPNQSIDLCYSLKGTKTEFTLNNQGNVYTTEKVLGKSNNMLAFTVDTTENIVKFDTTSSKKAIIKTYVNGQEYKGFDSGVVYLTFAFEGVSGASTFRVNTIGGKVLDDSGEDFARPKLALFGDFGGNYQPNEIVKLPSIVSTDVVDGILPVTMSVTAPDGSYIYDESGLLLYNVEVNKDYYIKLENYGSYKVSLRATDNDGNSYPYSFVYRVEYNKAPIINVSGVPTTGKVGKKIVLPTAKIEHSEFGGKTTLIMYLISDTGNIYKLTSPAFVPQRAGTYVVRYYCIDELGNNSMLNFNVKVS